MNRTIRLWRVRLAVGIFALGGVLWVDELLTLEGRHWQPAETRPYVMLAEAMVAPNKSQKGFPTNGTIGYRDDLSAVRPEGTEFHNEFYLMLSYAMAPVLLDRSGAHLGDYPITLVLGADGKLRFELRKSRR